jgi:uncharacterized protein YegJ (DUF2314 family)
MARSVSSSGKLSDMKRTLVLLLLASALAGCDQEPKDPNTVERPGQAPYTRSDDPALERAYAKARATHQQLVAALQNPKPEQKGFAVKKPFPTPKGGREHIWINDLTWDGTKFVGKINNEPVDTTAVKLGDQVTVTPMELTDWMYIDGKKLVGGYTLRVLHFKESPAQQKAFTDKTGLEIPPVDF